MASVVVIVPYALAVECQWMPMPGPIMNYHVQDE